jgi:hypothetical protein
MKLCITKIHLGRYKIDMLDDANQITSGFDCGSAGVIVALTEWIFRDEALQYQRDQRKSSDELGREAIQKMIADPTVNPKGLTPPSARLDGYYGCKLPPGACHCVQSQRFRCGRSFWKAPTA